MFTRGKNVFSVEDRLERLREAVIKEFGFASDTVKTSFHPQLPTNHEPTDFIHLHVLDASGENHKRRTDIQGFAADALQKIWLGKRPLVNLKMDLPPSIGQPRDPNAPPLQIPQ